MTSWSPMQLKIYINFVVVLVIYGIFLKNSELLKARDIIINLDRTCMYVKLVPNFTCHHMITYLIITITKLSNLIGYQLP